MVPEEALQVKTGNILETGERLATRIKLDLGRNT